MNIEILFEDNHLIAINKPAGVLVQGDETGDVCLADMVKSYLKERYGKPGNVFTGVIHRIDRPVSGVVLFAKTGKALTRLNEQFKIRAIRKTYWAVVKNLPVPSEGNLLHYLIKDQGTNKSRAFNSEKHNAKKAEMYYRLVGQSQSYALLEVKPVTGRHHQIRVQLAAIGCSIKGDLKYGFDRPNNDGSIHLHARSITLIHPTLKTELTITAPVPNEPLWQIFESLVQAS